MKISSLKSSGFELSYDVACARSEQLEEQIAVEASEFSDQLLPELFNELIFNGSLYRRGRARGRGYVPNQIQRAERLPVLVLP